MKSNVALDIEENIAIVTLNNPPVNALDTDTKEAVGQAFDAIAELDDKIRAVILTGGGKKAFAAGADIKAFPELTVESAKKRLDNSHANFARVENCKWPTIAAIHGFCLGGGLELALACDIRYASEESKLGFPEVNLGVFPGNGGGRRALYNVSFGKLKELIFSGDIISAREALSYGLIEKVVPEGEALDAALKLASKIATKGPLAIAASKKMLNSIRDMPIDKALQTETSLWASLAGTHDMKEGATAFMEKRPPVYKCK